MENIFWKIASYIPWYARTFVDIFRDLSQFPFRFSTSGKLQPKDSSIFLAISVLLSILINFPYIQDKGDIFRLLAISVFLWVFFISFHSIFVFLFWKVIGCRVEIEEIFCLFCYWFGSTSVIQSIFLAFLKGIEKSGILLDLGFNAKFIMVNMYAFAFLLNLVILCIFWKYFMYKFKINMNKLFLTYIFYIPLYIISQIPVYLLDLGVN